MPVLPDVPQPTRASRAAPASSAAKMRFSFIVDIPFVREASFVEECSHSIPFFVLLSRIRATAGENCAAACNTFMNRRFSASLQHQGFQIAVVDGGGKDDLGAGGTQLLELEDQMLQLGHTAAADLDEECIIARDVVALQHFLAVLDQVQERLVLGTGATERLMRASTYTRSAGRLSVTV